MLIQNVKICIRLHCEDVHSFAQFIWNEISWYFWNLVQFESNKLFDVLAWSLLNDEINSKNQINLMFSMSSIEFLYTDYQSYEEYEFFASDSVLFPLAI